MKKIIIFEIGIIIYFMNYGYFVNEAKMTKGEIILRSVAGFFVSKGGSRFSI